MPHVFTSYVRENSEQVQRLCTDLTKHGVIVWLDRNDIIPGTRWRQAIRRAIQQGSFFIACFSKEYNERERTFMNEELTLAIEELRLWPTDRAWFIPVKLNECHIPDRSIGGGEILEDLQYVELYKDWDAGIQRILDVINPVPESIVKCSSCGSILDESPSIPIEHRNPCPICGSKFRKFETALGNRLELKG